MRAFNKEPQLEIISATKKNTLGYKQEKDIWPVWHYHPEYDILLILKSRGNFIVGDYIGEFEPGTLVMTGPNIPHSFHSYEENENRDDSIAVIQFSEKSLGEALLDKPEMKQISEFLKKVRYGMKFDGLKKEDAINIITSMKEQDQTMRFISLMMLLKNFSENENCETLASPAYSPSLNQDNIDRIDKVINYIIKNYHKHISLEEISSHLNMSEKSFCRFFKKNTGKNFVRFVNEIRIGQACNLLTGSNLTISQICYETGFNNLSNFNRRFQEIKNQTPSEFRKTFKKSISN